MRPSVGSVAEDLYRRLAPLMTEDEAHGWAGLYLVGALTDPWMQDIEDIARDTDEYIGWERLLDPDETPAESLRWLGQFVGESIPPKPPAESAAAYALRMRELIKSKRVYSRGRPSSILSAIKETLTGSKACWMVERQTTAYTLALFSLTGETPDPPATLKYVRETQKPAGIVMSLTTVEGQTWRQLRDNYATWQDVKDAFPTWEDVRTNEPGGGRTY